jgi:hypothetical protein
VVKEPELAERRDEIATTRIAQSGAVGEDIDTREVLYGQSARFVTAIRSTAEVMRSIGNDAERQLRIRPTVLVR